MAAADPPRSNGRTDRRRVPPPPLPAAAAAITSVSIRPAFSSGAAAGGRRPRAVRLRKRGRTSGGGRLPTPRRRSRQPVTPRPPPEAKVRHVGHTVRPRRPQICPHRLALQLTRPLCRKFPQEIQRRCSKETSQKSNRDIRDIHCVAILMVAGQAKMRRKDTEICQFGHNQIRLMNGVTFQTRPTHPSKSLSSPSHHTTPRHTKRHAATDPRPFRQFPTSPPRLPRK